MLDICRKRQFELLQSNRGAIPPLQVIVKRGAVPLPSATVLSVPRARTTQQREYGLSMGPARLTRASKMGFWIRFEICTVTCLPYVPRKNEKQTGVYPPLVVWAGQ